MNGYDEIEEIFRRLHELRRRIENYVEEALRRSIEASRTLLEEEKGMLRPLWDAKGVLEPLYTIKDLGDRYIVYVDLPYANEGTIDIKFVGNEMIVEAKLKSGVRFSEWHRRYSETTFHSYKLSIELPITPDPKKVQVKARKGVIQVVIPKS